MKRSLKTILRGRNSASNAVSSCHVYGLMSEPSGDKTDLEINCNNACQKNRSTVVPTVIC